MGDGNTCDVCGGSETKLVDGFYYCAECGTQDTNVRETIVEHTALADGTFAFFSKTKYSVKIKDGVEMSSEWYKWHAYNFVLAGLTERMLMLGVEPSFKMKVLWIWAKYIKMHQDKQAMGLSDMPSEIEDKEKDTRDNEKNHDDENKDVKLPPLMTLRIIVGILYLALNLDRSTIQLSHLRRYMKDGRLHMHRTLEYIPKEIDRNTRELRGLTGDYRLKFTQAELPYTMQKFENLDLGPHLVPDLEAIIGNLLKELCLPKDLKSLVISLMDYAPINFLDKTKKSGMLPDSESVVISYILVALKMCFGLDDEYEIKLSDTVDEINDKENHLKAYKTDMYLEPSERLFSFREWYKYLLFRKHMLCKYYLPIAKECNLFLDDCVYMEQSKRKAKKDVKLSDEVTMDIINKIPDHNDFNVIPLSKFETSATPISTNTDVICGHLRDPGTRQLLGEDFTQYSINYACQDLSLTSSSAETSENIIVGVNKTGKIKNDLIGLHLFTSSSDSTMVFVKKCENRNWFKTKRPTAEHIIKEDCDHGYDSNIENSSAELNVNSNAVQEETIIEEDIRDKKLEVFEEEEEGKNIFDDDFLNTDAEDTKLDDTFQDFGSDFNETMETLRYEDSYYENNELEDSKVDIQRSLINTEIDAKPTFDPATFNREETIKQLMLAACNEYKVPVPKKFGPQELRKRKDCPNIETNAPNPKRAKLDEESKRKRAEKTYQIKEIVSAYHRSLARDVLHEVSQQVRSFVDNVEQNAINISLDQNPCADNDTNLDHNFEDNSDRLNENNLDQNEVDDDKSDDESIVDPVYKGEPKFDEKTHDAKQLYLKVKGDREPDNLLQLEDDEEISTLINEKTQQSSEVIPATDNSVCDPTDDLPISNLKKQKQRDKYESLIKNSEGLGEFNYWFKHYIPQFFKKGSGVGKRIDADIRESFPKSFVFVLSECAFVLNCSPYILYRYLTDIEDKMLLKGGFKKKIRSVKGAGVVLERRIWAERCNKGKAK